MCVTVVFVIDDRLILGSLDGLVSDDNLANGPYDLHNYGCGSSRMFEKALFTVIQRVFLRVTQLHFNAET